MNRANVASQSPWLRERSGANVAPEAAHVKVLPVVDHNIRAFGEHTFATLKKALVVR